MSWKFPIKNYEGIVPELPHLGAYGAVRKFHTHEGVDLYVDDGTPVYAVEDGIIVVIEPFTGPKDGSPWWNDTDCVMVEGKTGVIVYGEITPAADLKVGLKVTVGDLIGFVKQVLKKDKGRPMSMLHLELHKHGTRDAIPWLPNGEKPEDLQDPTQFLKEAYNSKV